MAFVGHPGKALAFLHSAIEPAGSEPVLAHPTDNPADEILDLLSSKAGPERSAESYEAGLMNKEKARINARLARNTSAGALIWNLMGVVAGNIDEEGEAKAGLPSSIKR